MIGYVTLGTSNIQRAADFYDALLGEIGATRVDDREEFILWAIGSDSPALGVTTPFDGNSMASWLVLTPRVEIKFTQSMKTRWS